MNRKTKGAAIIGRRWFQKSYGNTYHAVRVLLPNGTELASGKRYGYGDQYLQTAFELLQGAGLVPKGAEYSGTQALRETYGITWSVHDVSRERDL